MLVILNEECSTTLIGNKTKATAKYMPFFFLRFYLYFADKRKMIVIKNINCIKTASDENAVLSVFFGAQ